jgi:hypothetical protein
MKSLGNNTERKIKEIIKIKERRQSFLAIVGTVSTAHILYLVVQLTYTNLYLLHWEKEK